MEIEIHRLTPDLVEDYINFFDVTPHNLLRRGAKCYCVYWNSDGGGGGCGDSCGGESSYGNGDNSGVSSVDGGDDITGNGGGNGINLNTRAARRAYAAQCVIDGKIQGYLAYYDNIAVGWCNANTKADCLKCIGWQGMNGKRKGYIPTEESTPEIKIKSVYCFAIAPNMQRKGVATRLLERVCQDAAEDSFDYVEAYPDKTVTEKSEDFVGHAEMYKKMGFTIFHVTNRKLVMRKQL